MKNKLYVNELFNSIDGEGRRAGELASFIRLCGCNLRCSYCDTTYAFTEGTPMAVEEILSQLRYRNITLTGGEPLLQDVHLLLQRLQDRDVNIETNGSVSIRPYLSYSHVWFTVDYKSISSGMTTAMKEENFQLLRPQDVLKFVVGTHADLEQARKICAYFNPSCPIYISAVFAAIEPKEIVAYMEEYRLMNWRLQLQLHKYIWPPTARGV